MSSVNQNLADDYAGIASDAAKLSAQATAESLKHQFAASKEATVNAMHHAKDKIAGVTENATEKTKQTMANAKEHTGEFFHSVGSKIKSATAGALDKTADAAENLAMKMRH